MKHVSLFLKVEVLHNKVRHTQDILTAVTLLDYWYSKIVF